VENGELRALVERLTARLDVLEAENAELRRWWGQNSRNFSKPPSLDSPFAKPAPRSLRRRTGRKPGGQAGHAGSTLAQVADPHERLRHEPGWCGGCGGDLSGAPEVGMEKRQVFDLPPMTVRVVEHQLIARRCACGATTCGSAPKGVSAPVVVRAADHRDRPVPVCRAVFVQGAHRGRAGRVVRYPDLAGHRRGDDPARRRRAGGIPRAG